MPGIDDLFSPPNGPAYERQETPMGPPLEYVAEKLRSAVEASYNMCRIVLGVHPGLEVDARKDYAANPEGHQDLVL